MRFLAGAVLAAACLAGSGCLVLATVTAVGAVAATTIKTTGKVARTAVGTTARVASAAISGPGEPAALTEESAARLARPGLVVVVERDTGTRANLPWQEGMTLAVAAEKSGRYRAATLFRADGVRPVDLRQAWTGDLALQSGDVVELRR